MSACACGHDHARLGVRIEKRVLYRSAISGHRIKKYDAWGFSAAFWDAHRAEFDRVQIAERDTGHLYRTAATTFDRYAYREMLSAGYGLQVMLPLNRFNKPDEAEAEQPDAAPVQLILTDSHELQGSRFEKAKRPRPRIYRAKKPWARGA